MPFPISIIPSIIGAGASLVGGYINNQYAQSRADQQWNRTLYMQDKMNAYNAPVAQMQRLSDAGLNPNLVYANGGTVIQSAGGQPPAPPQSHPLDTQGVLQMVQTIVGAMLEKDKIQANKEMHAEQIQSDKDIAEARNTTEKEVTGMQTKSSERNVDVQTKSSERNVDVQTKSSERNVDVQTQTSKDIAEANLKENARQFDLSFAHQVSVDNARLAIDRSLANSTIALHSSQIQLNNLSAKLQEAIQPYLEDKAKYEALSLALTTGNQKLNAYLAQPIQLDLSTLGQLCKDAGLSSMSVRQLQDIASYHDKQVYLYKTLMSSDTERAFYSGELAEWNAVWGAASTPIKLGVAAATIK